MSVYKCPCGYEENENCLLDECDLYNEKFNNCSHNYNIDICSCCGKLTFPEQKNENDNNIMEFKEYIQDDGSDEKQDCFDIVSFTFWHKLEKRGIVEVVKKERGWGEKWEFKLNIKKLLKYKKELEEIEKQNEKNFLDGIKQIAIQSMPELDKDYEKFLKEEK